MKKVKKVITHVVYEDVIEDEEDVKLDEMIQYLNDKKKVYPQLYYYIFDDKNGHRKLEITAPYFEIPWVIRCSRYRFLVKTYNYINKEKQRELELEYGIKAYSRDLGVSQNNKLVIWECIYQNGKFDVERLKIWVNFLLDYKESPKPK